ncbi:uncharacterized protein [Diadema setosum]|uniref:uncharacterized protein n=1 Tax=Diadema setosum TaxID=31175 RepID=UPI003B3ABDB5
MENVPGDADATELPSELGSLPEVVESVSQAQKQQASEIAQHRKVLVDLQQQVEREQLTEESLQKELHGCQRKICLCQEDSQKKMTHCAQLKEEISEIVNQNAELRLKFERSQGEWNKKNRLIAKYRNKMENFSESVRNMEVLSTDHVELNENQRVIDDLERERDTLIAELVLDEERGELLAKVQMEEETHRLQIAKADLQQQVNHLQAEITKETSKQTSIRQDIEVLQKRNRAQLTRLKCQLKEAQVRNWQWSREASQLEAQLDQLTAASQTLHDE